MAKFDRVCASSADVCPLVSKQSARKCTTRAHPTAATTPASAMTPVDCTGRAAARPARRSALGPPKAKTRRSPPQHTSTFSITSACIRYSPKQPPTHASCRLRQPKRSHDFLSCCSGPLYSSLCCIHAAMELQTMHIHGVLWSWQLFWFRLQLALCLQLASALWVFHLSRRLRPGVHRMAAAVPALAVAAALPLLFDAESECFTLLAVC